MVEPVNLNLETPGRSPAIKFIRTTAINLILALRKRIKVIQGGSSAGKTIAILAILIDRACKNPLLEISVVSESIPHLRRGAYKDFIKLRKMTGRYNPDNHNKSQMTYTFSNGSYVEFFSVDDESKVRGPRRHILYINEANKINFETYHQLNSRTELEVFIDFNPTKKFWAHTELMQEDNVDFLILTYKHNEGRPANVDEEMARAKAKHDEGTNAYWINYWRVFGLGQNGVLQGAVWTEWSKIKEIPKNAELLVFGCDFGYKNSKTAITAIYEWMDPTVNRKRYIFDEWIHERGLFNKDIYQMMSSMGYSGDIIYCDYADQKSIAELSKLGLNTIDCAPKEDIRGYAIGKVSEDHFYVTESSTGLIEDLENYVYLLDKSGTSMNKPKKENDDGPDSIIYGIGSLDRYNGDYL